MVHIETWLVSWLKGALVKELLGPGSWAADGQTQVPCAARAGLHKAVGNTRDAQ